MKGERRPKIRGDRRETGDNQFWLSCKGVGIKIFPRCASTTLRETWGYPVPKQEALANDRVIIVVRNPWDRLLSVYEGMICANTADGLGALGYPPSTQTLDGLLEYILSYPPEHQDWHVRSMYDQLGDYEYTEEQLYTHKRVLARPPFGLPRPTRHDHQTKPHMRQEREYSPALREAWEEMYSRDWEMYHAAVEENGNV